MVRADIGVLPGVRTVCINGHCRHSAERPHLQRQPACSRGGWRCSVNGAVNMAKGRRAGRRGHGDGLVGAMGDEQVDELGEPGLPLIQQWRVAQAGVEVELRIGDAEDLPVEGGSFDAVLSNFGAIMAPRHEVVATELARVCRPGGTITFTAWPAHGPNERVAATIVDSLPPPPDFATPMHRWSDSDYVRDRFASHAVTFRFEHGTLPVEFASVEHFESTFLNNARPSRPGLPWKLPGAGTPRTRRSTRWSSTSTKPTTEPSGRPGRSCWPSAARPRTDAP